MRASTARLTNSPVRLADLQFPQVSRLIHRTRLAFIHLDNLLSYAKRDRDGRVDGYLCAHVPDGCLLLFFRKGEPVNAAAFEASGREVITIPEALRRMRAENERGDLTYCAAPMEQLAAEYNGKIKVAKLDVDENQRTAMRFNVRSIPSILFFKDGAHVDTLVGAYPKPVFDEKITRHIG